MDAKLVLNLHSQISLVNISGVPNSLCNILQNTKKMWVFNLRKLLVIPKHMKFATNYCSMKCRYCNWKQNLLWGEDQVHKLYFWFVLANLTSLKLFRKALNTYYRKLNQNSLKCKLMLQWFYFFSLLITQFSLEKCKQTNLIIACVVTSPLTKENFYHLKRLYLKWQ